MPLNPNKYLRSEILRVLSGVGVTVYDKGVPLDTTGIMEYILITSQTKNQFEDSKTCYNWQVSANIDINFVDPLGYNRSELVDDLESEIDVLLRGIVGLYDITTFSNDLTYDTKTHTVNRRVLTFSGWMTLSEI